MFACNLCQKGVHKVAYSRHKKGSSGASQWPLRAQIYKKTQKPNLHPYQGMRFCTKCLRLAKTAQKAKRTITPKEPQATA